MQSWSIPPLHYIYLPTSKKGETNKYYELATYNFPSYWYPIVKHMSSHLKCFFLFSSLGQTFVHTQLLPGIFFQIRPE